MDRSRSKSKVVGLITAAAIAAGLFGGAPLVAQASPARSEQTAAQHVPGQLVVKFRSGATEQAVVVAASAVGGHVTSVNPQLGTRVVKVNEQRASRAIDALRRNPNVEWVEPDAVVQATMTPDDPEWSRQWGNAKLRPRPRGTRPPVPPLL